MRFVKGPALVTAGLIAQLSICTSPEPVRMPVRGSLYVLCVGIGRYEGQVFLPGTIADAKDLEGEKEGILTFNDLRSRVSLIENPAPLPIASTFGSHVGIGQFVFVPK